MSTTQSGGPVGSGAPPRRAPGEDDSPLVCQRAEGPNGDEEWTFYEADREPERRTTRWLTVADADVVPAADWR
ncbi:hypothetical protein GCM10027435_15520 [Haloparvum alkalitolerans]|uniref:DUF7511 domain-containing protein n=1 Tax=Haloparvum TaxID=1820337 RepID=UPI00071E9D2D|nr:hypothetical protein [Haloparvum sedimenti]